MEVTPRLLVKRTEYADDGTLSIHVLPQVVDGAGLVIGSSESAWLYLREDDAIAAGVARGRTDGEWGNREIEDLIFAARVIDQPPVTAQPGAPAVIQNGVIVREEVPAIAGRAETYKPRFAAGTLVAWRA